MPVVGTFFYKGTGLLLDDDEDEDEDRGLTDTELAIAIIVPIVLLIRNYIDNLVIVIGILKCISLKKKEEEENKVVDTERMMKT